MARGAAPAAAFLLVVAAGVAGGWLLFRRSGPAATSPAPVGGGGGPAVPYAPPATREGALELLVREASAPRIAKGTGRVIVIEEVRLDALEALAAADPAAAKPVVLATLGGDGVPEAWSAARLRAAALRIRAGEADGAETVRAYLKGEEDLAGNDATIEAARAAAAMAPADGAGVVRRLLAEKAEAYEDEEIRAAVLQAAAALGDGATREELRKDLDSESWLVRGAAAGALLRLGDVPAIRLGEDESFIEAEEFARGLGAAGNVAALPPLERLLGDEEPFTRIAAVLACAAVGGEKAVAAAKGLLRDGDPSVRDAAAVALALLGAPGDLAAVRRAAAGKDPDVAVAAWRALFHAADEGSREAAAALLVAPPPKKGVAGMHNRRQVWAAGLIVRLAK